ncbi:putative PAS/PAC sensor protein (plasmid) [Methanohalobium evestigatum Z-7303]|uniref:Putative PAS/PAC sensor protein n=1 Tax=Methanohalobium evestigatum (strain ATCC BAA-1072 / DSM 3721 / NBRC 107634 / OCM 161 / Z-7303) TaxID=644295 RepID=D7EC38_METEZ|nr:PAS domain S-box protein [Methanohalobium evestigatum]ADI75160.1 putative PAS/PAC sensor protein [Methanohalobium evestigatum Z-7303]
MTDNKEYASSHLKEFFYLFNNMNDAAFVHDLAGNFLDINNTAIQRLGYPKDELLSMGPHSIDAPEYAEKVNNIIKQISEEKQLTFESVHITKSGERIPVEISSNIIQYKEQPAILSIARDITERKRAELNEKRYRLLFEKADDAIFILEGEGDGTGNIVDANQKAADIHGYSLDEILNMHITDLGTQSVADEFPLRLKRVFEGEWIKDELNHLDKNGNVIWMEVNAGQVELDGHKYIFAIERDITWRIQLETNLKQEHDQLEKQNQIRSILTGILPTLLKESPKEKRRVILKQMLDMIEKCMFHGECLNMTQFEYNNINTSNVGYMSCEVINQLGGDFSVDTSNQNDVQFAIKGTGCPWGIEQAKMNPILCNLTNGIIARTVSNVYKNPNVKTMKTMGNGDECCYFLIHH